MLTIITCLCLLMSIQDATPEVTVGMTGRLANLTLPGSELEAKPYDDRKIPILLRIRSVKRVGTEYVYDLQYQGYDPGSFDLKQYLRRKDGSSMDGVPDIPVKIIPLRPAGQVEPHALQNDSSFWMGGYRWWLLAGGLAWLYGLFLIIYYGFWPKRKLQAESVAAPATLADRLKPLVERAMTGNAKPEELASLERCLHTWWRRKLNLVHEPVSTSVSTLKSNPEAGPLLQQLETWLHRPGVVGQVDVSALLSPYRHLQPNELDSLLEKPA